MRFHGGLDHALTWIRLNTIRILAAKGIGDYAGAYATRRQFQIE